MANSSTTPEPSIIAAKVTSLASHPRIRPWLSKLKTYRRYHRMDRHLRSLFETSPSSLTDEQLIELWQSWGDDLPISRLPYIRTSIAEAARCAGPILQCGSSLSSILIGIICHQARAWSKQLWILEHDPHWGNMIRSYLKQYEIGKAHVISAPIEQFDGFVSYILDASRLPKSFALVLCDASVALPSSARGVMERMSDHLDDRCVFLARNAKRPRDLKRLADWAKKRSAPFVIRDEGDPYVKIALRDLSPDSDHHEQRLNTIYSKPARR